MPLLAVLFALVVGGVILLLLGVNPFEAYAAMISGAFGSTFGITQSIAKATPLLLVGLGICIAFRASVINIGAEGQIILGALGATAFSLAFRTLPGWLLIPLTMLVGFRVRCVLGFHSWCVEGALWRQRNSQHGDVECRGPANSHRYAARPVDGYGRRHGGHVSSAVRTVCPRRCGCRSLVPQTLLHTGAIVAVILAFVVYIFLWRTTIGYRIRAVGLNPDASRYAGIRVPGYQALALTLAGGFAGLAGVVEVIGVQHRLLDGITSGYGFSGIVAALFGGLHPLGTIPASYLFGSLLVGADKMQRAVQVPSSLVDVLLGLIVLFVVGSQYYARKRAARRASTKVTAVATTEEAVA